MPQLLPPSEAKSGADCVFIEVEETEAPVEAPAETSAEETAARALAWVREMQGLSEA